MDIDMGFRWRSVKEVFLKSVKNRHVHFCLSIVQHYSSLMLYFNNIKEIDNVLMVVFQHFQIKPQRSVKQEFIVTPHQNVL